MLVAHAVRLAQVSRQLLVIVAQLSEHIRGRNEIGAVIQNTLQAPNVTGRTQRRSANLADTLSDCVGSGKNLLGLIVE